LKLGERRAKFVEKGGRREKGRVGGSSCLSRLGGVGTLVDTCGSAQERIEWVKTYVALSQTRAESREA